MKTKNNKNHVGKLAAALFAFVLFSTVVMAQAQPDAARSSEVQQAYARLDALIVYTENAVRYTAPAEATDDLQSAWERMDLLAKETEQEVRYQAPEAQENAAEFADAESRESEGEFMTYKPKTSK
jgi:hypothetical protein